MEPAIAQALATLIGALTTAVLMASAYYWGPRQRDRREDARRHEDQWALEDDARSSDRESADADRRSRRHNIRKEDQIEEDENEQSIE